jgi:hypothetical protein
MTTFSVRFLSCKISQTDAREVPEHLLGATTVTEEGMPAV